MKAQKFNLNIKFTQDIVDGFAENGLPWLIQQINDACGELPDTERLALVEIRLKDGVARRMISNKEYIDKHWVDTYTEIGGNLLDELLAYILERPSMAFIYLYHNVLLEYK